MIKLDNKNIKLIKIKDFNYQNYIDYPILVKNKKKLNSFLLKKGFELRYIYYKNCELIFKKSNPICKNSKFFEEAMVCLPNHSKINHSYIDELIKNIDNFYKFNLHS